MAGRARAVRGHFRLSVDRVFIIKGIGLIVTGTAIAGRVAVGDSLCLYTARSPNEGITVRVRSIHAQDQAAATGEAGQRCALNLVGDVDCAGIERGDMLADARCVPGLRFDACLRLLDDLPFPLKHLHTVKLYVGARRLSARVYFLDTNTPPTAAGPERLVQFILKEPLQVCWGDRFLIQDDSESVILGGGAVLNPHAPQWHKRQPSRLARLREMNRQEPADILHAWLATDGPPIDLNEFKVALNLQNGELDALMALPDLASHMRVRKAGGDWLLTQAAWIGHQDKLYHQVADWHEAHPMDAGMPSPRLSQTRGELHSAAFAAATLEALLQDKRLQLDGALVRCAHHRPALSPVLEAAWQHLQVFLNERGLRIPLLSEIERELRLDPKVQTTVIAIAVKAGRLHQVSPKRVTLPTVLQCLAAEIHRLAGQQELFTVIEAKTHLGLGRDLTIEILEYFDRIHFTQRQGTGRRIKDADLPHKTFA